MSKYRSVSSQLFLVALVCGLASCESPAPEMGGDFVPAMPPAPRTISNEIVPGDVLQLFVLEDTTFNGPLTVLESGQVLVPRLGAIKVTGMSLSQAQGVIRGKLEATQLANPTVALDRIRRGNFQSFEEKAKMLIYVTGAVHRPGQHFIALTGSQPVLAYEALLIAGGPTEFADDRKVYILRRGSGGSRVNIPLDLRNIRQGRQNDVPLQEGDLITVPERRFGFGF